MPPGLSTIKYSSSQDEARWRLTNLSWPEIVERGQEDSKCCIDSDNPCECDQVVEGSNGDRKL
jgi:hypothetical protein